MKQDWFDKKLSDGLRKFDSEMDFESAWNNMEAQRNKKEKRGFLFWLCCIGFVATGSLAIAFSFKENKKELAASTYNSTISSEITVPNSGAKQKQYEGEITKPESTLLFLNSIQENGKSDQNEINDGKLVNTELNVVSKNKNQLLSTAKNDDPTINEKELIFPETPVNKVGLAIPSIKINEAIIQNLTPSVIYVKYNKQVVSVKIVDKKGSGRQPAKPSLQWGVAMSYGKYLRSLTAADIALSDWTNARNKIEKPLDVFYTELYLRKYFSERFFLQPGVGFLQLTSRLEEIVENKYTGLVDNQLLQIVRFADGTEEEIYGENTVNFTETNLVTKYQKSNSIILPVLLGVDLSFNKKAGLNVMAGASVSLLNKINGKTISNENTLGTYSDLSNFGYKKSGLLAGHGQVEFYFKLNKKWKIAAGVQTIIGLNNQVNKGNGFEEKFNCLGGRIALVNSF